MTASRSAKPLLRAPCHRFWLAALALLTGLALTACSGEATDPADGHPQWVVVGIDGGDWDVIQELMEAGRLPVLASIVRDGSAARLGTDYGPSPVIWTTIATGAVPEVHGITDFVAVTDSGNVPVSARVRRVPALWNMLSAARRQVAVLGWWASWPAEEVAGIVVSDRQGLDVDQTFSPPEAEARVAAWQRTASEAPLLFPGEEHPQRRDRLVAQAAQELVGEDYDLVLAYFRGVDLASHRYWKYWRPDDFEGVPARDVERYREIIPSTYEQVDAAIGSILEAMGERTNLLVISDHGFESMESEKARILMNFDRVLEHLGYLTHDGEAVDWSRTTLYTHATPRYQRQKKVRFALAGREDGGSVAAGDQEELRQRLENDLASVTYEGGEPAFRVRSASPREREAGADFVVSVLARNPTETLLHGNATWTDVTASVDVISGNHDKETDGIVFAIGPDLVAGADLEGMNIHDVAPTVLYGLGLPVAEDFAGRPWLSMFEDSFRTANRLRTIETWGKAQQGEVTESGADQELLEELRALGYIN